MEVGAHRLDLLVENRIIVELKALTELSDIHFFVFSYFAACALRTVRVFVISFFFFGSGLPGLGENGGLNGR